MQDNHGSMENSPNGKGNSFWTHFPRKPWLWRNSSKNVPLAILCDLFGMVKTWPFQRLSDLQLGDKKVTMNHLAHTFSFFLSFSHHLILLLPGWRSENLQWESVSAWWLHAWWCTPAAFPTHTTIAPASPWSNRHSAEDAGETSWQPCLFGLDSELGVAFTHTPSHSLRHAIAVHLTALLAFGCQFPPSIKGRSCQKGRGFLGETLVEMLDDSKDISYVQTPKNTVNQVG